MKSSSVVARARFLPVRASSSSYAVGAFVETVISTSTSCLRMNSMLTRMYGMKTLFGLYIVSKLLLYIRFMSLKYDGDFSTLTPFEILIMSLDSPAIIRSKISSKFLSIGCPHPLTSTFELFLSWFLNKDFMVFLPSAEYKSSLEISPL